MDFMGYEFVGHAILIVETKYDNVSNLYDSEYDKVLSFIHQLCIGHAICVGDRSD